MAPVLKRIGIENLPAQRHVLREAVANVAAAPLGLIIGLLRTIMRTQALLAVSHPRLLTTNDNEACYGTRKARD